MRLAGDQYSENGKKIQEMGNVILQLELLCELLPFGTCPDLRTDLC